MEAALTGSFGRIPLWSTHVTIGRTPDNLLVVSNPKVSSHHAEVRPEGISFSVVDLGSTNGTFVNEMRVDRSVPRLLQPGDILRVGDTTFTFEATNAPQIMPSAGDSTVPATPLPPPQPASMILDSFDAISTGRRSYAGLVYLIPLALSILSSLFTFIPASNGSMSSPIFLVLPYLAFLIIALIVVLATAKPSRFVRFHTIQSALWFGVVTIVATILEIIALSQQQAYNYYIGLSADAMWSTSSQLVILYLNQATQAGDQENTIVNVALVLDMLVFIVTLVVMIGAFRGKYAKLPLLSILADKFAGRSRVG